MPPKISKVGSSRSTKTVAKASTSSSSKSSGSSKTSSSSSVRKSAPPPPAPKPRNVDKVDFGKTRTIADAGVYHRPKPIAAATGRDPEPTPRASRPLSQNPDMRREAEKAPREEAIMRRARQEVKAEDFARSHTGTAIGNTIHAVPIAITGCQIGGIAGTIASTCASGGLLIAGGIQQDKGKMTIPQQYIYNALTDGISQKEREFVEENRASIDYAKEIIRQTDDIGEPKE